LKLIENLAIFMQITAFFVFAFNPLCRFHFPF